MIQQPWPSCSKLTMSLVNDSLKFLMAIIQIQCYFWLKKCENNAKDSHIFSITKKQKQQQQNSVFAFEVDI